MIIPDNRACQNFFRSNFLLQFFDCFVYAQRAFLLTEYSSEDNAPDKPEIWSI